MVIGYSAAKQYGKFRNEDMVATFSCLVTAVQQWRQMKMHNHCDSNVKIVIVISCIKQEYCNTFSLVLFGAIRLFPLRPVNKNNPVL